MVSFVLLIFLGLKLSFPLNPDQVPVCVVPPPPQITCGGSKLITFSFLVRTGSNRLQAGRPEPCDIQMWFLGQHPSQTRYLLTLQHPAALGAGPWGDRRLRRGVHLEMGRGLGECRERGEARGIVAGASERALGCWMLLPAPSQQDPLQSAWPLSSRGGIWSGWWTPLSVPAHKWEVFGNK